MVPPDIAARMRAAAVLFREGKFREAERAYRAVLRSEPENADALFMVGSLALQAGRARQAVSLLERATRRKPLQPEFHVGLGNALHQAGRAGEAEASYRSALALRPAYAEVRVNLAHLLVRCGRLDDALAECDAAVRDAPSLVDARLARARVLSMLGRLQSALDDAEFVLRMQPRHPGALFVRAQAARARGDLAAAELDLRRTLDVNPRHAGALNDLGVVLEQRGAGDEAERCYRRAVQAQPSLVEALRNLARRYLDQANWPESGRLWMRLVRLRPDDPQALMNVAFCLQKVRRPKMAAQYYERYLKLAPDDALVLNNLSSAKLAQGLHAEAETGYRALLARDPDNAEVLHNLGRALYSQQRLEEAEEALEKAQRRRPDHARMAASLGELRRAQGRAEEAVTWFERAVSLDPALHSAEESLSWVLLTVGDFPRGWALQRKVRARKADWLSRLARFPQPEWRGESLAGRTLLVWAEQGLGDQIMFLNALADVQAQARHVVLEASRRLVPLFQRSFPGIEVVPQRRDEPDPRLREADIDVQCAMSALPWFTRPTGDAFPAHAGYVVPDPERVKTWRKRLQASGTGPWIGISWRGGTETTGAERRSMPLAAWRDILRLPGLRFASLQYGQVGEEIAAVRNDLGVPLEHWDEAASDMEEHAALIAALDHVVTVCNTAFHMAGALGRPVWALVPARPGWRYLQRGERMPWYPSARLFRQPSPGKWDEVLEEVRRALAAQA